MREHEQVAQLARTVAHVVDQQRLGLEAERDEHGDQRLLVGDHLDDELGDAELERLEHGMTRECLSDAAAAVVGVDDDADLRHVARPSVQRDHRDVARDVATVERDRARVTGQHPGGDHVRVGDVLLQEGAVRVGNLVEEALERRPVAGL